MKVYGLIGYPLAHSFSRQYFTEKFQREGIEDCRYENYSLQSIDLLPGIIKMNPELRGLNVTIPYKRSILPFLNAVEIPYGVNACNCIRIKDGQMTGYNTDVVGFENSFAPNLQPGHK
ncbi:MAG TPA: shikimate dehydrogenase, partial [Ferruginibacter sp.]|nr:shikimate dehydrogenase [Ferruginibacter sp.]